MLNFARNHAGKIIEEDIGVAIASFREMNEEARKAHPIMLALYLRSAVTADRVQLDEDYIVTDKGKIVIVDVENTGRLLDRTFWSHGLHELVAIKHDLPLPPSTSTSAHMGHARMLQKYERLFCISGTIGDEADREELKEVYGMHGFDTPPHHPSVRKDSPITVVKTEEMWLRGIERWTAEITKGSAPRPMLIMTNSVAEALKVHAYLKGHGHTPQLLTDKLNQGATGEPLTEEIVIDRGGTAGALTIATNIAGRGSDFVLDEIARRNGGLHVLLAGVPVNKRVEYQGRGRSGRQGASGSSDIFACVAHSGLCRLCSDCSPLL